MEEALAVYEDRVEAVSAGGTDDCYPAQRVRAIIEVHAKFEKADRVKDSVSGATTGEALSLNKALVVVLQSQAFLEVAASIEEIMAGSVSKNGKKREKPLDVDVFLRSMHDREVSFLDRLPARKSL